MYGVSGTPDGGIIVEGKEGMDLYRMLVLESRLKMERSGLRFRPSGRTLAREMYGLRGSHTKVLAALVALRESRYPKPTEHTWGPFERTRLTGALIQRCTDEGCNVVNPYADDAEGPE